MVVAFKRDLFQLVTKEIVDYNDLVKLFELKPDNSRLSTRDFKVNNKAIICLLKHVSDSILLSLD